MAKGKTPQKEPKTSAERLQRKLEGGLAKEQATDIRWWLHDEPHLAVFAAGERIARTTRSRRMQDFYLACLYDDDELATLVHGSGTTSEYAPQTLSSNIIKRQVDAFVSKIAKNRPVPMGLTTGGNYSEQRRAKALSKFGQGMLDQVKYWETREQRLRDMALFGSGFAYNYRVGRKFHHDRCFPWELEVDPREAQYGRPRTLFFRRYIDRLELIERYPKFEEEILRSQSKADDDRFAIGWDETCDLVLVRGVWHLPSGETATDGAFALCVSDATLDLREYKRDYFPFSKSDFLGALIGWRGQGLAKPLIGLQYEVNAIGMRLQEQGYMTGSYVMVEDGAGIETDTIDNGALSIIRYSGTKPDFVNPAPWHPAFFDYYLTMRGRFASEETRLSEQATRGELPPGVESGRAIRSWHRLDDEAHIPAGRADERDVVDTMWQHFDLAEEIYAEGVEGEDSKPYIVRVESRSHGRSVLEEHDYAKVRLDRDKFTLRVFPTSFLSGTPEEVYERIEGMVNSGFLSQDEALALLDFPDLQRVMNLRTAARRNIERLLEKIKDADDPEEAYEEPVAAWNLELCKALALMNWLEAKLDGVPEANLEVIMRFALAADAQLESARMPANDVGALAQGEEGPMPGEQYAPPQGPMMPENAVAPEAMAALPTG